MIIIGQLAFCLLIQMVCKKWIVCVCLPSPHHWSSSSSTSVYILFLSPQVTKSGQWITSAHHIELPLIPLLSILSGDHRASSLMLSHVLSSLVNLYFYLLLFRYFIHPPRVSSLFFNCPFLFLAPKTSIVDSCLVPSFTFHALFALKKSRTQKEGRKMKMIIMIKIMMMMLMVGSQEDNIRRRRRSKRVLK